MSCQKRNLVPDRNSLLGTVLVPGWESFSPKVGIFEKNISSVLMNNIPLLMKKVPLLMKKVPLLMKKVPFIARPNMQIQESACRKAFQEVWQAPRGNIRPNIEVTKT